MYAATTHHVSERARETSTASLDSARASHIPTLLLILMSRGSKNVFVGFEGSCGGGVRGVIQWFTVTRIIKMLEGIRLFTRPLHANHASEHRRYALQYSEGVCEL